ncbi:MAG TPA: S-methyl-5'-thioadenosine phosphorylase [Deltaproteobacteria bacterium]|nr:MAG: methylthioadenosine phosphorylase [Deltaproteobacteria bacterium GWA2_45_12]HBF13070.1 S-methyl-5'-thioadenosine phosphorylase [Deltaproteobacteria bacterium]
MTKPQSLIGIIGGSGLYAMAAFVLKKKINLKTPFGKPSDSFMMGELSGVPVVFLPRHGVGHQINPTEINFRANIWGMKKLGVSQIISVSAVGSLKEEIKPGHMVAVDQFIDRTRQRVSTFFEKGIVAHVSFADPVCARIRKALIESSQRSRAFVHKTGTYVCMEGPAFSTRAESHWYRSLNADVIGMTNLQEAKLAREAEICYSTLALSTDYDCWHVSEEAVTTDQILVVLHQNIEMAQKIIGDCVTHLQDEPACPCHKAVAHAILTDKKKISPAAKQRLKLIVGKYLS